MKKICFVFSVLLCANLGALLSPLYQSAEEMQTILKGEQLGSLPAGEPIVEIHRKKGDDGYEVLTPNYRVSVKVKYLPQKHPGPALFDLEYGQPERR